MHDIGLGDDNGHVLVKDAHSGPAVASWFQWRWGTTGRSAAGDDATIGVTATGTKRIQAGMAEAVQADVAHVLFVAMVAPTALQCQHNVLRQDRHISRSTLDSAACVPHRPGAGIVHEDEGEECDGSEHKEENPSALVVVENVKEYGVDNEVDEPTESSNEGGCVC